MNLLELKYGQWDVEFKIKNAGNSWVDGKPMNDYISFEIVGNWRCDSGIFYNIDKTSSFSNPQVIGYNDPELLPRGLKERILKRCLRIKKVYKI